MDAAARSGSRPRAVLKAIPGLVPVVQRGRLLRRELNAVAHGFRTGAVAARVRRAAARESFARQSARTVATYLPLASIAGLARALDELGIRHHAMDAGLYVPPQAELEPLVGARSASLPPSSAYLVSARTGNRAASLLRVANVLHAAGGPRPYDAFVLHDGATSRTVVALEEAPKRRFRARCSVIAATSTLIDAGRLSPRHARWTDQGYFASVADAAEPVYLGFDNFDPPAPGALAKELLDREARSDLHFGTEYALRGRRYLYQSVPIAGASGRRNSLRRWKRIRSMMAESDVGVSDRVVLDVGCNAGMMLAATLADGAAWGVGWDLPRVVEHGDGLLRALGYSRFDLVGAELDERYPLLDDIPEFLRPRLDGAVVLYLAIRHHIGFASALADVPWRALVYEGGEEESVQTLEEHLAGLRALCRFRVASAIDFRDGETRSRPLALLLRT
jgi:hypothetical protein